MKKTKTISTPLCNLPNKIKNIVSQSTAKYKTAHLSDMNGDMLIYTY